MSDELKAAVELLRKRLLAYRAAEENECRTYRAHQDAKTATFLAHVAVNEAKNALDRLLRGDASPDSVLPLTVDTPPGASSPPPG